LGHLYTWILFFFPLLMFNCLGLVTFDKGLIQLSVLGFLTPSFIHLSIFGFSVCWDTLSILLDIKHDKDISSIMWIIHLRKGTQPKISSVSWVQVTKCNFSSAKGTVFWKVEHPLWGGGNHGPKWKETK
jgi:hypothetical protein